MIDHLIHVKSYPRVLLVVGFEGDVHFSLQNIQSAELQQMREQRCKAATLLCQSRTNSGSGGHRTGDIQARSPVGILKGTKGVISSVRAQPTSISEA